MPASLASAPTLRSRTRRVLGASAVALTLAGSAACQADSPSPRAQSSTARPSTGSSAPQPSSSSTSASPPPSTSTPSTTTTATATAAPSCAERTAARLTPAQRVGQLLMVGLQPTGSSRALATQVAQDHLGAVIYLGGWQGSGTVREVSQRLQRATSGSGKATGGVGLLIAADQEGGQVQQLRGEGFTRIPSARVQATMGTAALESGARTWAREMLRAGVNVNLAPVADTVPLSVGAANDPIGAHRRDFVPGDAKANGRYAAAFVRGFLAGDVAPTVKHFPGLGRVTGNTDLTSVGTTDRVATRDDPYLQPFAAGIHAGAPLVMISSARYPRLDPDNQAMFSKAIVTDLLRTRMGFVGVVVTDDVGAARAVASVPVPERATRFIAAGGDIVLTANAAQAPAMRAGITARMKASPAFARQVEAAVLRVLTLKTRLGLVQCGG